MSCMPPSESIHADQGRKLLVIKIRKMSGKGLVYYILGAIALVGAAYFFFRWLDLKFLLPLLLAIAAVILFWKGSAASKNK